MSGYGYGNNNRYGGGGGGGGYRGGGGGGRELGERDLYKESNTTRNITLNCPFCKTIETYELRWLVRKKIERLPNHADERVRAIYAKFLSYMVLIDDHADCKNLRCRKRFEISGVKTTAFI